MAFPWELGIGKAEAALLEELLLDLRGHPRLTRWEEQFVADIQSVLREHGPRTRLSDKQVAVLEKLREKVGAPARELEDFGGTDPDGPDL
ncbi:hypothetical protein JMJ56_29455 [Belnapia sp. T18]|uniref:Uncharacterized protein n=1 Tax=Belnapia arida TaxID=2804533 RepID=A0ABS1UBP5_9PROT|nr:hypothetical protein [Belnapia arida]MBL6082108.1 hypothetical protein [Belnapia arida]